MIGFIIWIIGLILAIKAVLEIMQWKVDGVKKRKYSANYRY